MPKRTIRPNSRASDEDYLSWLRMRSVDRTLDEISAASGAAPTTILTRTNSIAREDLAHSIDDPGAAKAYWPEVANREAGR